MEMDQERNIIVEKRQQEKDYLQKMLKENDKNQVKMRQEKENERLLDVRA